MSNQPTTRCREYKEGCIGRRRTYICQKCGAKFQEDRLTSLPEIDRVCPECREHTHVYTFTNKRTGKDVQVRAPNAELATLRAWEINPNLTFKIPQPELNETLGGKG